MGPTAGSCAGRLVLREHHNTLTFTTHQQQAGFFILTQLQPLSLDPPVASGFTGVYRFDEDVDLF